jgi:CheY-like chemotaxis protein
MGHSGTGLGMAVVWGTVKDHNGYIDVVSIEGRGTTISVYLPASREEIFTDQQPLSLEKYLGRGETVLIVDDMPDQLEIASHLLKKLGYRVATVASGEQAVEYVKEHSIDLLVLDMIMEPGIDGLETYRRIIRFKPDQKAIIASGFSESSRVKEAERLGAGAYIKKPYLLEDIGKAIRAELSR